MNAMTLCWTQLHCFKVYCGCKRPGDLACAWTNLPLREGRSCVYKHLLSLVKIPSLQNTHHKQSSISINYSIHKTFSQTTHNTSQWIPSSEFQPVITLVLVLAATMAPGISSPFQSILTTTLQERRQLRLRDHPGRWSHRIQGGQQGGMLLQHQMRSTSVVTNRLSGCKGRKRQPVHPCPSRWRCHLRQGRRANPQPQG